MSKICESCKGSGVDSTKKVEPGTEAVMCSECGGNGKAVEKAE